MSSDYEEQFFETPYLETSDPKVMNFSRIVPEPRFKLDHWFDDIIDEIKNKYIPYVLDESNPVLLVNFNKSVRIQGMFNQAIDALFTNAVHKNMRHDGATPECDKEIKRTLEDEMAYEKKNFKLNLKRIDTEPESRGQSNGCAIRLNNVLPVKFGTDPVKEKDYSFIVKRFTRFTTINKHDLNFIGSKCPASLKTDLYFFNEETKGRDGKVKSEKKSIFRNNECEFREFFTCLILSHYLRKMYGNVCPQIYGFYLIPKYIVNYFNGKEVIRREIKHEIIVIEEKMEFTLEQFLKKNLNELDEKSRREKFNKIIQDLIYLNFALHYNTIPKQLVQRFSFVLFPNDENLSTYIESRKLYLSFFDCKLDNIMIDSDGNWRIIDIDGIMISDSSKLEKFDKNPLLCGLDTSRFFNGLADNVNFVNNLKRMSEVLKTDYQLNVIRFTDETYINSISVDSVSINPKFTLNVNNVDSGISVSNVINNIKKIFDVRTDEIARQIATQIICLYIYINQDGPMTEYTGGGSFYTKYIKYKTKYLNLKKKIGTL